MLIDLNEIRPQNESQEHFFLKQVGRAYLFKQGIRCIATEVDGMFAHEMPPFGTKKVIMDVVGVDKRNKRHEPSVRLQETINEKALDIGRKRKLVETSKWGKDMFISSHGLKGNAKTSIDVGIEQCYKDACKELGYHDTLYRALRFYSEDIHQLRGIEVKVSYNDFKNGFCMLPEYTYVLAPTGIVPKDELPTKVGLLEFDFKNYYELVEKQDNEAWFKAITVTKRPKKTYDERFMTTKNKKTYFERGEHAMFCERLLYTIAQQNTEEHIFWNPHLFHVKHTFLSDFWHEKYQYAIGQETPLGRVCDRRIGQYTYKKGENDPSNPYGLKKNTHMLYYRFLHEKGYSPWKPAFHVNQEIDQRKKEWIVKKERIRNLEDYVMFYTTCQQEGFQLLQRGTKKAISLQDVLSSNDIKKLCNETSIYFFKEETSSKTKKKKPLF